MKGNRLNTAANVGSFVTGRQSLGQQRKIAGNTGQMANEMSQLLALQQKQALDNDYDRLMARMDRAVAEGRMTREEADIAFELEWYNKIHSAPVPGARIMPTPSGAIDVYFRGTPAGWYQEADGKARYWDGSDWTLETLPKHAAKKVVREDWLATTPEGRPQKSRVTAGVLALLLGSLGAHRFYLGNKGVGLLMLLLCVILGVMALFWVITLWAVVEGVMILSKSKAFERDADGVPLK